MKWRAQYDDIYFQMEQAGVFSRKINDYELEFLYARHVAHNDR